MGHQPSVSAVVVTYNRRSNLGPLVDRLLASDATNELVVVVNGSRDGSIELLEQRKLEDSRISPLYTENQRVGGARQRGVEHARGDVVGVFDDAGLVARRA